MSVAGLDEGGVELTQVTAPSDSGSPAVLGVVVEEHPAKDTPLNRSVLIHN